MFHTDKNKHNVDTSNLVTPQKANMPNSVTLTMKSNLPHVSHGNIVLYEASLEHIDVQL